LILSQFQSVGHELFTRGLVSSHSGNLSIRLGERIIITRRSSSRLGCLQEHDLIETGINKNDRSTPLASIELAVHRAIYQQTPALAIVHTHPPHAVALSLTETEIVPSDAGLSIVGCVPVLGWHMEVRPGGLADIIAQALKQHKIIMVRGHGSFAIGQLLEEAHNYTTTLEESCQVLCLLRSLQVSQAKQ